MKKDCKTCTVNSTNDTVETCKRPCYLRYSKQRKDRICDLENEIAKRNKMLMDAHFQNKKLADELLIAQTQYNKVVEQNRDLQKQVKELEEMYCLGG